MGLVLVWCDDVRNYQTVKYGMVLGSLVRLGIYKSYNRAWDGHGHRCLSFLDVSPYVYV